eukprot:TRINITY_DN69873_c0_g1_i1.p1 TRINITY_DN69873_c0_g1~~TRINITY_DN69873_c0_g1_i1.p1  ORF type:complete len:370 (+),score=21.76 TRINITY_DN69873_c0_g1_i1:23-1111(+)
MPTSNRRHRIVVTGDDYGVNPRRTQGIIKGFKEGILTDAIMLVNGEDPEGSVAAARECGLISHLGLHVNLTEGVPVSPPNTIPSLVGTNGRFLGKVGFFLRAHSEAGISTEDVKTEILAQIKKFTQLTQFAPTHADGHHFVHIFEPVVDTFAKVFASESIRTTRIPEDLAYLSSFTSPHQFTSNDATCWNGESFYRTVAKLANPARHKYVSLGVQSTDKYTGICLMGKDSTPQRLTSLLRSVFTTHLLPLTEQTTSATSTLMEPPSLPNGNQNSENNTDCETESPPSDVDTNKEAPTIEIMAHPGLMVLPPHEGGPKQKDEFWHCYFSCLEDREQELSTLMDVGVKKALLENSHELSHWAAV